MTIDIHKIISNNKISRNLLKPWGSSYDRNDNSKSLRKKLFNSYTGPSNDVSRQIDLTLKQVKFIKYMINHFHQTIVVQCIMILNIVLLKI